MNKEIKPPNISFPQERSSLTVDSILEAAIKVLEKEEDFRFPTTQQLVSRSGFSVGSIYRYFKDKNDLYGKVWDHHVQKIHRELAIKLDAFAETGTVQDLMTLMVDHYLDHCRNKRTAFTIPLFRIFIRKHPTPEKLHMQTDQILDSLNALIVRNRTGTIKALSREELKLFVGAGFSMIRNTYMEESPYFATPHHRSTTIAAMIKLFSE
jgi:AcrR family transcriptional regulator